MQCFPTSQADLVPQEGPLSSLTLRILLAKYLLHALEYLTGHIMHTIGKTTGEKVMAHQINVQKNRAYIMTYYD